MKKLIGFGFVLLIVMGLAAVLVKKRRADSDTACGPEDDGYGRIDI